MGRPLWAVFQLSYSMAIQVVAVPPWYWPEGIHYGLKPKGVGHYNCSKTALNNMSYFTTVNIIVSYTKDKRQHLYLSPKASIKG